MYCGADSIVDCLCYVGYVSSTIVLEKMFEFGACSLSLGTLALVLVVCVCVQVCAYDVIIFNHI